MFENAFASAVSMMLFVFGISIAFIFVSGYLWSRERKRILLE
jgi:heme/copper-type cytochrome/quinol oxidase subunit 4